MLWISAVIMYMYILYVPMSYIPFYFLQLSVVCVYVYNLYPMT